VSGSLLAPLGGDFGASSALALILVGGTCGAVGVWVLHFGQAILAESFTHALLAGLVLAALLGASLFLGALIGVLVAYALILLAVRTPKTSQPTGISAAVSTLVAAGALLATAGPGVHGLESLLFGDPLAASRTDVLAAAVLALVIGGSLLALGGQFAALAFDRGSAAALGVNVGRVSAVALLLLAVSVSLAANIAGSLLALALVVGPAWGAAAISTRLGPTLLLAAVSGALGGLAGLYLSWFSGWPAAPCVALVIVCWALACSGGRELRSRTPRLG
jgi:ABC-type Mn2+/Zn2+ transport system permease subunit